MNRATLDYDFINILSLARKKGNDKIKRIDEIYFLFPIQIKIYFSKGNQIITFCALF